MQVSKWGNSLAVRLPSAVAKALDLKEGDEIEIVLAATGVTDGPVRRFEAARPLTRREIIDGLDELRGLMAPGYRFDREEANAR